MNKLQMPVMFKSHAEFSDFSYVLALQSASSYSAGDSSSRGENGYV